MGQRVKGWEALVNQIDRRIMVQLKNLQCLLMTSLAKTMIVFYQSGFWEPDECCPQELPLVLELEKLGVYLSFSDVFEIVFYIEKKP